MTLEQRIEQQARFIAALKVGSTDLTGAKLPDDLWRQAIPEAIRAIKQMDASDEAEHFWLEQQAGR
jgi:hypothetical protein